ncbi:MAG: hypothetical protein ACHQNE_08290 [Candidatus Kapaibacterium sp.]
MDNKEFFPAGDRRTLKVICVALPAGVILMTLIALSISSEKTTTLNAATLDAIRVVHVVVTAAAILIQKFLYRRILEGKIPLGWPRNIGGTFAMRYRVATIVKLALFEGSALFGIVIILTASIGGFLQSDPTLYLHLIPVLMLLGAAQGSYPSDQKIATLAQAYQSEPAI